MDNIFHIKKSEECVLSQNGRRRVNSRGDSVCTTDTQEQKEEQTGSRQLGKEPAVVRMLRRIVRSTAKITEYHNNTVIYIYSFNITAK